MKIKYLREVIKIKWLYERIFEILICDRPLITKEGRRLLILRSIQEKEIQKMKEIKLRKSKRTIKYIVVHCSATPEGRHHTAKDIDLWHKQRGFSEIGYNYVIQLNGTIETGRDVDKIPAHVENFNKESIGICYVGGVSSPNHFLASAHTSKGGEKSPLLRGGLGGEPKDTRTKEQKESLLKLLKELKKLYPNAEILGHRDFPKVKKACPSFDAKTEYKDL